MKIQDLFVRLSLKVVGPLWLRVLQSPYALRMAKGAVWSLSGAFISRGLAFVSSIIVARFLGIRGYGEFGVIQNTIGMFGMIAGLGLGTTATKYIAQYRDSDKVKTGRIIAMTIMVAFIASAVVSILLFFFSGWLATTSLAGPHLETILQVSALHLFFLSLIGLQNGILAGFEAFRLIAIRSIIAGASTFPLMVGGVYFFGIKGAIWGLVGGSLINFILNFLAIRKILFEYDIRVKTNNCLSEKHIIREYSLPAFLAGVMVGPVNWICNSILVNQPDGYFEMGIYNAANQVMIIILFIPSTLASIILPMLSNVVQDSSTKRFSVILKKNLIINTCIAAVISLVVILFSGRIMLNFGEPYAEGRIVLITLALTAILVSYNSVIGQAIASKGKMWIGLILNFIWAIVLILVTYQSAKNDEGSFGFAKANLYAYSFLALSTSLYIKLIKK